MQKLFSIILSLLLLLSSSGVSYAKHFCGEFVMIEKVTQAAKMFDVMIGNFGHAGDGNLHPTCLTDERDKNEIC